MKCILCKGTGEIIEPNGKKKNMELKKKAAKLLRIENYSIREIMKIMNYKSPKSVQDLLDN